MELELNQQDIQVATPETTIDIGVEYLVAGDEELEKPYRVIIQNDDVTPMEFVVIVLRMFFELDLEHAMNVMLEAHYKGRAYVKTLPLQEAQERVYAAHNAAREENYPLTFYLEPED